jgi:Tfp pilus assembly protein PilF
VRIPTSSTIWFVGLVAILGGTALYLKVREVQEAPPIRFIHDEAISVGARLLEAGDERAAERQFKTAVANSPDNIEIKLAVATIYSRVGNKKKTLEYVRAAESQAAGYRDWIRLGDLAMGANAPIQQTERYYRECLRLRPNDPVTKNNLAYAFSLANTRLAEAEKMVKEAIAVSSSNAAYTDTLGWVYYRQGLYKKAQRELEAAVALDSTSPELREHLGEVYKKLGLKTRAEVEFYKAKILRANPSPRPSMPTE